jgi:hypothetical protein
VLEARWRGAKPRGLRVLSHPPIGAVKRSGLRRRLESGRCARAHGDRHDPLPANRGRLTAAARGARSKRDGARKGVAIDTSAFRHHGESIGEVAERAC